MTGIRVSDQLFDKQAVLAQPLNRLDQIAAQFKFHDALQDELLHQIVKVAVANPQQTEYLVALFVLQAESVVRGFQFGNEVHQTIAYHRSVVAVIFDEIFELDDEMPMDLPYLVNIDE